MDQRLATPESGSLRSHSVDEVRAGLQARYGSRAALTPTTDPASFAYRLDFLRYGPLNVGDVRYGTEVRGRVPDSDRYHVSVSLAGYTESEQHGVPITASPHLAAVYQPTGEISVRRVSADCRTLGLRIDSAALEAEAESLLDRPVDAPLRLAPSLDVSQGPGLSWLRLLHLFAAEIGNRDGLLYQPLAADQLVRSLLAGLLVAVEHQHRDALTPPRYRRQSPCRPRGVKRAIDAMQDHPERPLTMTMLAEIAGTSVRSLQEGFQRHVGVPPMTYLRQLRLVRAHEELGQADPRQVTVAKVAYRWGFPHLGRFAAAYRAKYGVAPSQTLRGGA